MVESSRDPDEITPDDFDRPDLEMDPRAHAARAEVAAERGEEYDAKAVEERAAEMMEDAPDPIQPIDGLE